MLGHSLHGERTRQHPVYPAGGGDNIVLSGNIVYTVLNGGHIIEVFQNTSPDCKSHFQTPFAFFFMNSWIMQEPYTRRPLTMIP